MLDKKGVRTKVAVELMNAKGIEISKQATELEAYKKIAKTILISTTTGVTLKKIHSFLLEFQGDKVNGSDAYRAKIFYESKDNHWKSSLFEELGYDVDMYIKAYESKTIQTMNDVAKVMVKFCVSMAKHPKIHKQDPIGMYNKNGTEYAYNLMGKPLALTYTEKVKVKKSKNKKYAEYYQRYINGIRPIVVEEKPVFENIIRSRKDSTIITFLYQGVESLFMQRLCDELKIKRDVLLTFDSLTVKDSIADIDTAVKNVCHTLSADFGFEINFKMSQEILKFGKYDKFTNLDDNEWVPQNKFDEMCDAQLGNFLHESDVIHDRYKKWSKRNADFKLDQEINDGLDERPEEIDESNELDEYPEFAE